MFNFFKRKIFGRKKIVIEYLGSDKKIVIEEPLPNMQGDIAIHYYEGDKIVTGTCLAPQDRKRLPYQVAEIVLSYFANRFEELYKEN